MCVPNFIKIAQTALENLSREGVTRECMVLKTDTSPISLQKTINIGMLVSLRGRPNVRELRTDRQTERRTFFKYVHEVEILNSETRKYKQKQSQYCHYLIGT